MHGPTHLAVSWFVGEAVGLRSPKARRIVALSGLAPDIDVLAYLGAIVYFGFDKDKAFGQVWQVVHHRYTHGLGFILLTGLLVYWLVARTASKPGMDSPTKVAFWAMAASVTHNFFDLVGGGPTWPIYPAWPLADTPWSVPWSWTLAEWPNAVILFACLGGMFWYAKLRGYSPLEAINYRLDAWFCGIVQQGRTGGSGAVADGPGARRTRIVIYLGLILLILAVLIPLGFRLD